MTTQKEVNTKDQQRLSEIKEEMDILRKERYELMVKNNMCVCAGFQHSITCSEHWANLPDWQSNIPF